jgi:hypothetical protein
LRRGSSEIQESFGFVPFGISQGLATILLVKQRIQALLHSVRQMKLRQIVGDFDPN